MTPSRSHEEIKSILGCLFDAWCIEQGVEFIRSPALGDKQCAVSRLENPGISVRGRTVSENDVPVEDVEEFVIDWPGEAPTG